MTDELAGQGAGATGDPARDHPSWTPGTHYLEQVAVDWDGVRAIDVVTVDLDDEAQEGGVLAKVKQLVDTHVRLDALAEPMAEALPADEHGPFRGEVIPPEEGRTTAEIRVTHGALVEDD